MMKKIHLLLFLLVVLCLSGCGENSTGNENKNYTIYYKNLSGTKLEGKEYNPVSDRFDGILKELIAQFENCTCSDVVSAMPENVKINGYTTGIDDIQVDFSASYLSMTNIEEVLLRAGLVETLVQLPGIVRVSFTVDGQPLRDHDGQEVSAMNEETFIDNRGNGINSYHYVTLELYFSNSSGKKIVKEMRNVFYSSNLIMEKVIVEQIIKGPVNEQLLPVVGSSVTIKNVQISKGICVIDLDKKFLDGPGDINVDPETCLYAFIDAICEACDVKGVQFRIDGNSDERFMGQVNLDQVFEWNADIIEATDVSEPLAEVLLDANGQEKETSAQQAAAADAEAEKLSEAASPEMSLTESSDTSDVSAATEGETEDSTANKGSSAGTPGVGVDPALVEDQQN